MVCDILCEGHKLTKQQLRPFAGDVDMADYLTLNEMTNRFVSGNRRAFIDRSNGKIVYIVHCIQAKNMDNIYDMYSYGFDAYVNGNTNAKIPDVNTAEEKRAFLATTYNMLFAVLMHLAVKMIREYGDLYGSRAVMNG